MLIIYKVSTPAYFIVLKSLPRYLCSVLKFATSGVLYSISLLEFEIILLVF